MTRPDHKDHSSRTRRPGSRISRLVPASGSVDDLIDNVGRDRRRQIALMPFQLAADSPSGLWIATVRADYIVYPADASSAERTAIISHELSHMILDHQPEAGADHLAQLTELVAPHVAPTVAHQFLARHGYADALEADAEQLATLLVTQLHRNAHTDAVRQDAVSDRLR